MFIHKLVARFFPKMAEEMERESREWMIQCPGCKHEVSVWDAGGIRYRARGNPRKLGKCSRCGKLRMFRIYRAERGSDDASID